MQKYSTLWLIGCVAILLFASGCFQPAGSNPQSLSVAQNTGPTFTPFPSDTPPATLTPDTIIITATLDPFAQQVQSFPTLDQGQQLIATQAPPVSQSLDDVYITATYIVGQATNAAALQLTGTACALGLCAPTATQVPVFVPTQAPVPGTDCVHEVRAEDVNLYRISLRYGVTVDQIVAATTPPILNPNLITIGEKLTIPGCGTTGAVPPATSVPTFTTGGDVGVATAIPVPSGNPAAPGTTYIVKQYDTLFSISMQTGVPVQSIANANGIQNINLILLGQTLNIPSS